MAKKKKKAAKKKKRRQSLTFRAIGINKTTPKIKGGFVALSWNGGGDFRLLEPKWLTYAVIDKFIQKLRDMHRNHPEWFEVPKFAQKLY